MTTFHQHNGPGAVGFQSEGTFNVNVNQWKPGYRIEDFPVAPKRIRPKELAVQPSRLLLSRHRLVPFTGRRAEIDGLTEWRDDTEEPGLAVRLLYGPGGQGKTRLAAHFAELSRAAGWAVWQAEQEESGDPVRAEPPGPAAPAGTLVVVDYAERWSVDALHELFQDPLLSNRPGRVRILLLSRPADLWWEGLAGWLDRRLDVVADACPLAPLADEPARRTALFEQARDRFAALLGLPEDRAEDLRPPAALAEGKEYAQVLTIHAAALVAVDACLHGDEAPADPVRASAHLLRREIEHWDALNRRMPQPMSTDPTTMRKAVFIATLTRPISDGNGHKALRRARVAGTDEVVGRVLHDHGYCYPPLADNTVLEPLYPDRLGEDLIGLTVPGHTVATKLKTLPWAGDVLQDLLLDPEAGTPAPWARDALTVLIETARRWPHIATGQLYPLLTAHPELAREAGGAALITLLGLDGVGIDLLEAIEPRLPKSPHIDLDVAAAAVVRRTAAHRLATTEEPADRADILVELAKRLAWAQQSEDAVAANREAVALLRDLAVGDPAAHEPALADALGQLGFSLAGLGLRQEALEATRQALAIHRRLAEADPQQYEADYARSLVNLGAHSADVGLLREALAAAEEAAPVYRRVAAADPSQEGDLALALTNLGSLRSRLGLRAEALAPTEEAVALGVRLADADAQLYGPLLAQARGNLGVQLTRLGRRQEARQETTKAVELRRRQAAANPQAYGPDLAMELSNLAGNQQELGEREEAKLRAQEAVEIYRRLAGANPRKFEPGLAEALNNLGAAMGDLVMSEESVAIRRWLVDANPQAYRPALAEALVTLGALLADAGRRTEALAITEEATALCRELAAGNPLAHQAGLGTVLANLAKQLIGVGRHAEALETAEEAVELWRALAAGDPQAHAPGLAQGLINLGTARSNAGRSAEALAATEEAVSHCRRLAAANARAHEPGLALALSNLPGYLLAAGRRVEALEAGEESVAIYRRLAQTDRSYEHVLAMALSNLGTAGGGLAAVEEAAAVFRRLAVDNPAAHEPELAIALDNVVHLLLQAGRLEEALAVSEEAVALSRRLVAAGLSAHEPALATAVLNRGFALSRADRQQDALLACQEAVELGRMVVERHGPAHEWRLAMALGNLAAALYGAGRREEAQAALEEAVSLHRSVVVAEPGRLPLLIGALTRLGFLYRSTEQWSAMVETVEESVAIHRRLADADPATHEPALTAWLNDLAFALWKAERSAEALETLAESVGIHRRLAVTDPDRFLAPLRTLEEMRAKGLEKLGRTAEAAEIRERLGEDAPGDA